MRQYFKGATNLSMFRHSGERIQREGEMETVGEDMEGVRTLRGGGGMRARKQVVSLFKTEACFSVALI